MFDDESNACLACERPFHTVFRWRHHCRRCGILVCSDCSPNRLPVKGLKPGNHRVCGDCFEAAMVSRRERDINCEFTDSAYFSPAPIILIRHVNIFFCHLNRLRTTPNKYHAAHAFIECCALVSAPPAPTGPGSSSAAAAPAATATAATDATTAATAAEKPAVG